MNLFIRICFLFFGMMFCTAQQTFRFEGRIVDFHDKVPLAGAQIKLGNLSALSDKNGSFLFPKVSANAYLLEVSHPKCETLSENLTLTEDLHKTIFLEHHLTEIETVTVHALTKNQGTTAVKTLDRDFIQKNSTENLGNLLAQLSGVSALKSGNSISKPIIHGMYGSRIAILNNGVKMAEQEWGVEHAPNIDAAQFEHIDVIRGASALKYGSDVMGGVVLLLPDNFKKIDSAFGAVNSSVFSNGRGFSTDFKLAQSWKSGWALKSTANYRKSGDLKTPDYFLKNTGSDFKSFSAGVQNNSFLRGISLDYNLVSQEVGIYRGSHIGSLQDFYQVLHSQKPFYAEDFSYAVNNPKQEVSHHIAKISAYQRFSSIGKITLDYNIQFNHRKEYDLRRGELNEIPALDLELYTHQASISHLLERGNRSLESGLNFTYQYNYSTPETQARRLVPNYSKYSGGVFSVFRYRFSSSWNAEVGARYDLSRYYVKKWFDESDWQVRYAAQFPQFYVKTEGNRVFTEPELTFKNSSLSSGVRWKASNRINFRLGYAFASRTPDIAELFSDGLHHSAAVVERGDMSLKSEHAHQFNLNIEMILPILSGFSLSADPYLFLSQNFINQVPEGIQNTIRGVFPVWVYQQSDATMYGLDLDASLAVTPELKYSGRFSYIYGEDRTNNQPLILMVPPSLVNSLEFKKEKFRNFFINIQNQTVFRQTRFPLYNPVVKVFENGASVEKVLDLSTPPPSYSLWTVQTGLDLASNLNLGLKVTNLFNTSYRDYLNRMRFFADENGRNILINLLFTF